MPSVATPPLRSVRRPRTVTAARTASPPPSGTRPAGFQPPDAFAAYLHNPKPAYPRRARRHHWQGLVLLRVQVGTDGRPLRVDLARSSGHASLDRAALRAVKAWRFRPARRDGEAVTAEVEVPIRFRLKKG